MDGRSALIGRLGELDEARLRALLERRPDVLAGAWPRDLTDLAYRLWHPHSLVQQLRRSPLPVLQVLEAAQALGGRCPRAALAELLEGDGAAHRVTLQRILDDLVAAAVIVPDGRDRIVLPEAFDEIFPSPLCLGTPLAVLLREQPLTTIRRIQTVLGLPKQRTLAESVSAVLAHLGDPDTVRAVVAEAPGDIRDYLTTVALGAPPVRNFYDPDAYRLTAAATEWATDRGLLVGSTWAHDRRMPAEVARALRGPDFSAPFRPVAPAVPTTPVETAVVTAQCAAAAAAFADNLLAILDHIARSPVTALRSGGIGARELGKLAKAIGADETIVRLVVELVDELGLLGYTDQHVVVSDAFPAWRDDDPAARFGAVLTGWWTLGATPTQARDADGKALRALASAEYCEGCRAARAGLLETLAELGGRADRAAVAPLAGWRHPLVHLVAQDGEDAYATIWREAELLGVLADGAITDLGRALVRGGDPVEAARALLPPSTDHATFGSDLTAYVVGAPSRHVSALLDSAADRESRGAATTWRFTTASVRRAFDHGASVDVLTTALAGVATGPLPQPLSYLITDVARRHGTLRLVRAATCIRSDDPALLAEVAADRKLAKFGLRLLAPSVLAAEVPLPQLLEALRAGGYFPVGEDNAEGSDEPSAVAIRRPAPRRPDHLRSQRQDAGAVAAALIAAPPGDVDIELTPTEDELANLAPALSLPEIRQLAHAIDTNSAVRIQYLAASGGRSDRVIRRPELVGNSLFAWCELRSDDRVFTVGRIQSVLAVD